MNFFAFFIGILREKQDNCKALFRIKNKPEILYNKIETQAKFHCVKLKVHFNSKKPSNYNVFLECYQ